jgi:hypothetical protein
MRLVYYALVDLGDDRYVQQWLRSVGSLRRHNRDIAVHILVYNSVPPLMRSEARRLAVTIHEPGNFTDRLYRLHVHGSIWAGHPAFCKFICLQYLPLKETSQALYLDCDTFFFGDVEILFDQYQEFDWYAREEPTTHLSYLEYDSKHIDEQVLGRITAAEVVRAISPFNTGICLLNHRAWQKFDRVRITYLDTAWRLAVGWWLALPDDSEDEMDVQRYIAETVGEFDIARALSYPSDTLWLVDQITLWLTLGRITHGSHGFFRRTQVAQNGEFQEAIRNGEPPVVTHYFTNNEAIFFSAVDAMPVEGQRRPDDG